MTLWQLKGDLWIWSTGVLLLCVTFCSAYAQLRLADVWQSGMVIQQDKPIQLWVWAVPGQTVRIQFGDEQRQAIMREDSSWSLQCQPRDASANPNQLTTKTG